MIKKLLLITLLFTALAGYGQTKSPANKDFAKQPLWIQMIDVEGVSFTETVKAFEIYWQNHIMPEDEGDRYIGKGDQKKKKLTKKELKEGREEAAMRFQIKRYEHWKIKNEPFVKEDGHIMTAAERLKFHNSQ